MSHIIDSEFYADSWGTQEMRDVFDDRRRYQRWLDVEVVLARVQAELGVIPAEAAEEIERNARVELLDLDRIKKRLVETSHSLVPLLEAVEARCRNGLGEYIHYGPTTQDVEDTGSILEMRDAYGILLRDLIRLEKATLALAQKHRELPMAGRTHNQQGLPITLGLKFAGWAAELRRDIERMKDMKKRVFVGLLHGGTGTMAGLGEQAIETVRRVMDRLGLEVPVTGWGSARDIVAEYQVVLGMVAGTVGRVANEIYQLSRTEIGELQEPLGEHYVGSSTMPHKRNAETTELVVAMARIVMSNVQLALQAMISEHERDTRSWRLDWHSIPESSILLARALGATIGVVEGLDIDEARIRANLDMLHGMLFSEALMFHLGKQLGKQTAHRLVREAALKSTGGEKTFRELVLEDPAISAHISADELNELMDYSVHIGQSVRQIEDVVAASQRLSASDREFLGPSVG
ncbi:MAG: adenylosuccinate lyase family protein [Acidobacteriota bacterium]